MGIYKTISSYPQRYMITGIIELVIDLMLPFEILFLVLNILAYGGVYIGPVY